MVIKVSRILLLFLLIFDYHMNGQLIKNKAEGNSWYKIHNQEISADGKWVYFTKRFDNFKVEGILMNIRNKKTFRFEDSQKVVLNDNFFLAMQSDNRMAFVQTKNGMQKEIPSVKSFYAGNNSSAVIILTNGDWCVLDRTGNLQQKGLGIKKVEAFENDRFLMLYMADKAALLDTKFLKVHFQTDFSSENILAQHHSEASRTSRFLIKKDNKLYINKYFWDNDKVYSVPAKGLDNSFSQFSFGDSDILIATKPTNYNEKTNEIELWDSDEKALKPYLERNRKIGYDAIVLDYLQDEIFVNNFSDEVTSRYLVFGDQYLLEVNDLANDTSTTEFIIPKISLRRLGSSKEEFSVQNTRFYTPISELNLLFYFDKHDWYFYNVLTKENTNITHNLDDEFFNTNRMNIKQTNPVDYIYFSKDFSSAYLTSRNNIWKMDLHKKIMKNLTQNSDNNISYSILNRKPTSVQKLKWTSTKIIQEDNLIIKGVSKDELSEALFSIGNEQTTTIEPFGNYHFDQLIINDLYISYTMENFNTPYNLVITDAKGKEKQSVKYLLSLNNFPKAEISRWKNQQGNPEFLTVILPPDYNPLIKYPTIVRVYENEAKSFKFFEYPSYYNQAGFNASLLALDNYIILYPRINYKINEAGKSAFVSVMEAIDYAEKKYSIDKDRLGIIGHSFGGYETNYIITQTPIFKVAISGASISNILGSYFTMSKKYFRPNIWRYTDQSFRFSDGFFNLKEEYVNNNPIFFTDRITTPILLWAGKEDRHIDWEESLSFFIAMKDLNKTSRLLLFPGESHTLTDLNHQKEATKVFKEWFDKYLK
ncbi:alpha/beta hydrolase family protein [Kaistella sp.]|uniref:alpha/beta hydrolase family protein n=1 Tax=Kaistella sp. TaxID=2782235 RepID=UPI003C5761AD